jgi:hypothetical protein
VPLLASDHANQLRGEVASNGVGVNRFESSADGRTLRETKIQTKQEIVPAGTDPAKGVLIGTSTSVLVFDKLF